jgi:hypothetical protein
MLVACRLTGPGRQVDIVAMARHRDDAHHAAAAALNARRTRRSAGLRASQAAFGAFRVDDLSRSRRGRFRPIRGDTPVLSAD